MLQKPLWMKYKLLDWKWPASVPAPLELFRKFIPFGGATKAIQMQILIQIHIKTMVSPRVVWVLGKFGPWCGKLGPDRLGPGRLGPGRLGPPAIPFDTPVTGMGAPYVRAQFAAKNHKGSNLPRTGGLGWGNMQVPLRVTGQGSALKWRRNTKRGTATAEADYATQTQTQIQILLENRLILIGWKGKKDKQTNNGGIR